MPPCRLPPLLMLIACCRHAIFDCRHDTPHAADYYDAASLIIYFFMFRFSLRHYFRYRQLSLLMPLRQRAAYAMSDPLFSMPLLMPLYDAILR